MFETPINFVRKLRGNKHIVMFYEEPEYARAIAFEFIKSGLTNNQPCAYISNEDQNILMNDMRGSSIDPERVHIQQLGDQIPEVLSERLTQMKSGPWAIKEDRPDRVVLMDSTIICTYPVSDILTTIKSSDYGAWMNELLLIHNGAIYARQFYKGVAFVWQ